MASFGSLLQKARNRKRISLDDVARETRLAKRYLQALESESLSKLPGGAYNRAYLRTYATFLGLDPDKLMREYQEEEASQTEAGRLSVRPDALETIRQAAALKQPAPGLLARALAAWSGTLGRVATAIGGVGLLAALGWLGAPHFTDAPGRRVSSDGSVAMATPASESRVRSEVSSATAPSSPRRANAGSATEGAAGGARTESESGPGGETVSSPVGTRLVSEVEAARDVPDALASEGDAVEGRAGALTTGSEQTNNAAATTPPAAPDSVSLAVPASGVGTDVVDRQLVGRSETFSVGTRVVFWTQIVGGGSGDSVSHVWQHNGLTTGIVELPVGGPSWRTQSRRTLDPDAEGTWVVEARDAEGRVLARHEFRCES